MSGSRAEQLRLALGPYENRNLFSDHFLRDILPTWPEFAAADANSLMTDLAHLWDSEKGVLEQANEAQTEERFIKPVLARLGFFFTVQAGVPTASGRRQPDYALFVDDDTRAEAEEHSGTGRFSGAVAVGDAKRFDRPLDRRRVKGELSEDPVAQIIHYVAITRTRWGILTNGRLWRLYAAEGDLIEGACLEFDLCALLDARDPEAFRYFAVLLAAAAFVSDAGGRSLLDRALAESRAQTIAVGDALRRQVFGAVPLVAEGLLGTDERSAEALAAAFDNALVVLYRVLFCLHAEDRGLLPVNNVHYLQYSLRNQRTRLAADIAVGRVFSSRSDDLFNDLRALFRIIDQGDLALGVNEYNGGLFSAKGHIWLHGRTVNDEQMSRALDLLYRVDGAQVDYRDLSVRHLGTIFEQLLAFKLAETATGSLDLVAATGRKATGAYFTPDHIVDEIVERTLGPILDRRSDEIAAARMSGPRAFGRLLDIHVLDPAMGSGHFLVSAAAYIARRIANDPSNDAEPSLPELQGLVAERCLYGVDVNAMAVEIARLALWLTTVRSDRPLRFLANLRHGNSLVSCDLPALLDAEANLFAAQLATRAIGMLDRIGAIASTDTATGEQAHEKERIQNELDTLKEPLLRICGEAVRPPVGPAAGPPMHWQIEFPERFIAADGSLLANGGFDAVIGNPPYVRIQELGREVANYCRQNYSTASGSFDAFIPFIERGVDLLAPGGRLGFIVPSAFLKVEYAARLRTRLAGRGLVEQIIDFGHAQVFEAATNYTCIIVLSRDRQDELAYVAVHGTTSDVRRAVATHSFPRAECYRASELGDAPWILLPRDERAIIDRLTAAGPSLGEASQQIFQGLITGADPIYIFEDCGSHGARHVLSVKDGSQLELEHDLLRPLASGSDVERYALRPLESLLLFPYLRDGHGMRLISADELAELPLTRAYLFQHEAELRARDRARMDRDGWWAFSRTQSLALHALPKLGVAATVRRLEVAADFQAAAYFHNVRVNGILPRDGGPQLSELTAVLNSRVVDFAFRRGAAPQQNGFFMANKQFIAWLPIPASIPPELGALGVRLYELVAAIEAERTGFLSWLASVIGARPRDLSGSEALANFAQTGLDSVLDVLDKNADRLSVDPRRRTERERISVELAASVTKIGELSVERERLERQVDIALYDAYGLTQEQQRRVDGEYQ
jgi:type I restriction-modification system DNA methylase subunit